MLPRSRRPRQTRRRAPRRPRCRRRRRRCRGPARGARSRSRAGRACRHPRDRVPPRPAPAWAHICRRCRRPCCFRGRRPARDDRRGRDRHHLALALIVNQRARHRAQAEEVGLEREGGIVDLLAQQVLPALSPEMRRLPGLCSRSPRRRSPGARFGHGCSPSGLASIAACAPSRLPMRRSCAAISCFTPVMSTSRLNSLKSAETPSTCARGGGRNAIRRDVGAGRLHCLLPELRHPDLASVAANLEREDPACRPAARWRCRRTWRCRVAATSAIAAGRCHAPMKPASRSRRSGACTTPRM